MDVLTSSHVESVLVWVELDGFVVLGRVARVCELRVRVWWMRICGPGCRERREKKRAQLRADEG
jgi:hypothetical protein